MNLGKTSFSLVSFQGVLDSRDPDGDGEIGEGGTGVTIGDLPGRAAMDALILNDTADEIARGWRDNPDSIRVTRRDGGWPFYWQQLHYPNADATRRQLWEDARQGWLTRYGDYSMDHNGEVLQFALYTAGFYMGYGLDGDSYSFERMKELAQYTRLRWEDFAEGSDDNWTTHRQRPTAYALQALLLWEQTVGRSNMNLQDHGNNTDDPDVSFQQLLHKSEYQMHQCLQQWSVHSDIPGISDAYLKPFYVGLQVSALARYHEIHGNDLWVGTFFSDIPTAITQVLEYMREQAVVSDKDSDGNAGKSMWIPPGHEDGHADWGRFRYTDGRGSSGSGWIACDTVIAPGYMYAAVLTGDTKFVDYADEMFQSHMNWTNWYWGGSYKDWNQTFHLLPDLLRWRREFQARYGDGTYSVPPNPWAGDPSVIDWSAL